jgi:hypothetical protein
VDTDEITVIDEGTDTGDQSNDKMTFFPKTNNENGQSGMYFTNPAYTNGDESVPINEYPGESMRYNGWYTVLCGYYMGYFNNIFLIMYPKIDCI